MSKQAIVVGAGIVGLATARALAVRQYKVTVLERNEHATGASIRNFGMVWPIGQPTGELYERAMLTKSIWEQIAAESRIWHDANGSLHVARSTAEWNVLQEFAAASQYREYKLVSPGKTMELSPYSVQQGILGSLYSGEEMLVDPRQAISTIPAWLEEKYGVRFLWGKAVTDISYPSAYAGREELRADLIFVCSGADFETLFPEVFTQLPVTKCKLQMMRMTAQPARIGPSLCGGLSLIHYNSFKTVSSWPVLQQKLEEQYPDYIACGIHVMVAQNQVGELTVGDSHAYGLTPSPFDQQYINQLILDYLKTMARFDDERIVETWNGVYPRLTNGETELVINPEQGVTIINCLGGAGMTLSFGLCEQVVKRAVNSEVSVK